MLRTTLCALAVVLLLGTPAAQASMNTGRGLGYTPLITPPPPRARHWDGTLNGVREASLRQVETEDGAVHIRGKRERSRVRHQMWLAGLAGDRLEVLNRLGYPASRYFEQVGHAVVERWTYPGEHVQFGFVGDTLVERHLH